jgi:hypothetical protein
MPYCPNCGKEVKEDAVYCPYCGQSLKEGERVVYTHPRDEKNEKGEKDEKHEKGEKNEKSEKNEGSGAMWGGIMGGLILLWLGVAFLLRQYNYVAYGNWFSVFLLGLGAIILLRGLLMYTQMSNWRASSGLIIGGGIVMLIGGSTFIGLTDWWALILVLAGGWIILNAFMGRGGNPRP